MCVVKDKESYIEFIMFNGDQIPRDDDGNVVDSISGKPVKIPFFYWMGSNGMTVFNAECFSARLPSLMRDVWEVDSIIRRSKGAMPVSPKELASDERGDVIRRAYEIETRYDNKAVEEILNA